MRVFSGQIGKASDETFAVANQSWLHEGIPGFFSDAWS
jgi:hypothetical protein